MTSGIAIHVWLFSILLTMWFVQTVRLIFAQRKLKILEKEKKDASKISPHLERAVQSLQQFSQVGVSYPDKDGDGVPDAFQRRKPLSEMLEFEKPPGNHSNDYWVAIELPARPPDKGEYFISPQGINKADFDYANYNAVIIKSVPGTNLDDLVDLRNENY